MIFIFSGLLKTKNLLLFLLVSLSSLLAAQAWRWYPIANLNELITNGIVITRLQQGNDSVLIAGTDISGILRSTNLGKSWSRTNITSFWIRSFTRDPQRDIYFAGTFGNGVLRSTDGGKLWVSANNGLTDNFIYSVYMFPGSSTVFAGATGKVFRSTDYGQTWQLFNLGVSAKINVIESGPDNVTLYAGTENNGLFRSDDNGATWLQLINPMQGLSVISILKNPSGDLYAGTKSGLYKLLPERINWAYCGNGLPGTSAWSIVQNSRGWIFACFTSGVYGSTDRGDTWSEVNIGLEDPNVNALVISGDREFMFAGTQGGFIFRSEGTLTSVSGEFAGTQKLGLYPNPATDKITVVIPSLPGISAEAEIYTATGKFITRKDFTAGNGPNTSLILPLPSGCSPGVYFVRISYAGKRFALPFIIQRF